MPRRLAQHNSGLVESTRHRRPLELIHSEALALIPDARSREQVLKRNPKMLRNFKKRMGNCAAATKVAREGMG